MTAIVFRLTSTSSASHLQSFRLLDTVHPTTRRPPYAQARPGGPCMRLPHSRPIGRDPRCMRTAAAEADMERRWSTRGGAVAWLAVLLRSALQVRTLSLFLHETSQRLGPRPHGQSARHAPQSHGTFLLLTRRRTSQLFLPRPQRLTPQLRALLFPFPRGKRAFCAVWF